MSLSMRECIRWLKKEISEIVEEDPPLTDENVSTFVSTLQKRNISSCRIFRLETA